MKSAPSEGPGTWKRAGRLVEGTGWAIWDPAWNGVRLCAAVFSEQKEPALQRGGRVGMTDIDPRADLELHASDGHVTVSVPLAGAVTGDWLRCYQKLALATKVPVQAQARHDRAWIVVSVPVSSDREQVAATLDAARALIAKTDAAAERPPATAEAEASVRDWWAGRLGSVPRTPVSGPGMAGARAEKRWPMAFTLVLAIAVPLLLPRRFSLGPAWAIPAVEALLLVAIVAVDRGRIDRRSTAGRALALVLVAVLVADAAWVTGRLITDLIEGGPETNSATDLLKTGQARTGSPPRAVPPARGGDGLHPLPPVLGCGRPGPRRGDPSALGRSSP